MKTNRIILQWLHLIFMWRAAPWNICGCTALLLLSAPPTLHYLFSSLLFSSIWHKWVWSLHPEPWFDPPSFSPLTLPLVPSHPHETCGPPGPHPSSCHPCIPCFSCSPCQLDLSSPWSHPVVLTDHTTGLSPSHTLNLVSFVSNFKLSSTVCLLFILYNARALRCSSEQGKLHHPALKEMPGSSPVHLAHDSPCVWNDHCPPIHLCFCIFMPVLSSRPSSFPSLLLEAQNLWPEVISSVTKPSLLCFFTCMIHTWGFLLSLLSVQAP